ncbi:MAG: carbamate kinase [Gemmatimonadales bacterium]|nr:carbamate kinase [Gemmatimonadales bacterium]NIN50214.1 carbamate kinase [Gemmatimonadales bacterium]NIP07678.1 carbamate kinase [Gemmatimonadales bacterium]NIS65733.1 carbamate kinase [Gemmatimonadales bacterium]
MSPRIIVVALGGNALSPPGERATIHGQFRHTRESLAAVVALASEGWHIAIVHGNGPQVGDELERNELAYERVAPLPLGVLVASTAGWIGYMIQQSLQNALLRAGIRREVLTVITQTEVDRTGPAATRPRKPVGHELAREIVERLQRRGVPVGEDGSGRWRRLAPSPKPLDVVEADAVRRLVTEGKIVIAAGGGGPPVYFDDHLYWEGVDAVVDKDRVAAILGSRLGADTLLILTDVDAVYRGWGTDHAEPLRRLTLEAAEELLNSEELGRGSMRPKVEAAVAFVRSGGKRAIIADLADGLAAIRGATGTAITGELSESP